MFSFTKEIDLNGLGRSASTTDRPCAKVCGIGSAELVLLRQVLGLCLRLSLRLSADCPSHKGG